MDSAYYAASVIAAARRNGARFSVTAPVSNSIRAAITAERAWQVIAYPQAPGRPTPLLGLRRRGGHGPFEMTNVRV